MHTIETENDKLNIFFNLIAGNRNYHGDDILAAIKCKKNKEVNHLKPLD